MSYDDEFFLRYAEYLKEPQVRDKHDEALAWAAGYLPRRLNVVELGCGLAEFKDWVDDEWGARSHELHAWKGVDNKIRREDLRPYIFQADYRAVHGWWDRMRSAPPNVFASLFSTECCLETELRHRFYEHLFSLPWIETGVTAGFYYSHENTKSQVEEAGGILSWQTIDYLGDYTSALFEERRLILHVPSAMFGGDVYEVWKVMTKRK